MTMRYYLANQKLLLLFLSKCWNDIKTNEFSYTVGNNVNFYNHKWNNSIETPPKPKHKHIAHYPTSGHICKGNKSVYQRILLSNSH